jgi:hypothetical protein
LFNATTSRKFLIAIAIAGLTGQCLLSLYFSGLLVPQGLIAQTLSERQLSVLVAKHQSAILLDAWLMGMGSFLSVVFYVGLVQVSAAVFRVSGLLTIIAGTVLVAIAFVDVTFMVAAVKSAAIGHTGTTKIAFDFVAGPGESFDYTFIFGPAPMLSILLGIVLTRSGTFPVFFGYAAIAIGVLFFVAGLLSICDPGGSLATTTLEIVQISRGIWVFGVGIFILSFRNKSARVN